MTSFSWWQLSHIPIYGWRNLVWLLGHSDCHIKQPLMIILMTTRLLSCACLSPGWGAHVARLSCSDWQPWLDRGLRFTPRLWILRIAGIAPLWILRIAEIAPLLSFLFPYFSSLYIPSPSLSPFLFYLCSLSYFVCLNVPLSLCLEEQPSLSMPVWAGPTSQ